jgi:hypothetical protein
MAIFEDEKGTPWRISLTAGTLEDLKTGPAAVDLLHDTAQTIADLGDEPSRFFDVLFYLVERQAATELADEVAEAIAAEKTQIALATEAGGEQPQPRGLAYHQRRAFRDRLAPEVMPKAAEAFTQALIDFFLAFRPALGRILKAAAKAGVEHQKGIDRIIDEQIANGSIEKMVSANAKKEENELRERFEQATQRGTQSTASPE